VINTGSTTANATSTINRVLNERRERRSLITLPPSATTANFAIAEKMNTLWPTRGSDPLKQPWNDRTV
jgi:hypothetical protein